MRINIPSETGVLNEVIVHSPGREVSLVNPNLKEELLFDGIIFESDDHYEHIDMLKILQTAMPESGKIFEIMDLSEEIFQSEDVRAEFTEVMIKELPFQSIHTFGCELFKLKPMNFVHFVAKGILEDQSSNLHRAPILLFICDLAAVVGESIILSRAANTARVREFLFMRVIVQHHALFESGRNNVVTVGGHQAIEGGDFIVASEEIAFIGRSERTSFSGLVQVAEQLLRHGIEHVLEVGIPKQRSSMHLDNIFTFIDKSECVAFHPSIEEKENNVIDLFLEEADVRCRQCKSLKQTLEELSSKEFTFIKCGPKNRLDSLREQWTDRATLFALNPGIVIGYGRNTKTVHA